MSESSTESEPSSILWDVARYVIVAVVAGVLIWLYCFNVPLNYLSREHIGKTMGTDYIVKVAQFPENADWNKVADAIQHRLDALEQMLSTYRHDSEVCLFNASTSTEDWFSVSKETAFIVQASLEISQVSESAFDITIAPLVRHWGFGAGGSASRRSFEELKSSAVLLKDQTGYEKLSVRLDPPALKKGIPDLAIDLSAIGKGFAVDCIAELLDEQKITDYLIEVGGEVRAKGKKSKGKDRNWLDYLMLGKGEKSKDKDWVVGIEKPTSEFSGTQHTLPLMNQSMATSGNYRQAAQMGDHRISHLIDPRTGLPVQVESELGELVSVSVIAPTCTLADAWATALFVLGEQKGLELANQHGIAVLFLLRGGNGIAEISSKHW